MEDADFHVRAMREFGAYFMDKIAIYYRIGSPSLMHSPKPDELQLRRQHAGSRRMQVKYREERGVLEYYALALFARTVLTILYKAQGNNRGILRTSLFVTAGNFW